MVFSSNYFLLLGMFTLNNCSLAQAALSPAPKNLEFGKDFAHFRSQNAWADSGYKISFRFLRSVSSNGAGNEMDEGETHAARKQMRKNLLFASESVK